MLSEISHTEKDRYCMISLICGIQKAKLIVTESKTELGEVGNETMSIKRCY